MGGVAYFAANDGIHGEELWRSDGTVSGTYMVKDVNPWYRIINVIQGTTEPDDSDISELTVAGDKIFFFAEMAPWSHIQIASFGSQMVQRKGQSKSWPMACSIRPSHKLYHSLDRI